MCDLGEQPCATCTCTSPEAEEGAVLGVGDIEYNSYIVLI